MARRRVQYVVTLAALIVPVRRYFTTELQTEYHMVQGIYIVMHTVVSGDSQTHNSGMPYT